MKRLWMASEDSAAQLLIIELDKAGIAATMHHNKFPITHMLTLDAFPQTEVLVLQEDFEAARGVLARFLEEAEDAEPAEDWQCPKCREIIDGNFTVCWNCGAADIDEPEEPEEHADSN